jgi:hypothetical protein
MISPLQFIIDKNANVTAFTDFLNLDTIDNNFALFSLLGEIPCNISFQLKSLVYLQQASYLNH